jgi:release factor glutamine methyltransferase
VTRTASGLSRLGVLSEATAALENVGVENARQDAEWLLASVLELERFRLYLDPGRELSRTEALRYRSLVDRRATRVPLQHLLGFEEFHGVRVAVSPDVLIPRPETEGLVQWATEILRDERAPVIADVGTGSGAIACALAWSVPTLRVLAIDSSLPALAVAARNVRTLGLSGSVKLLAGDLLEPLRPCSLDLVVANPPYLPSAVVASLPPEVSRFEPRLALDGGPDGMAVLRRIIAATPSVLRPGGCLMMEIGEEQAGSLASLLAAEGFTGIDARRDLTGRERYIAGRWANGPVGAPRRPSLPRRTC